MSTANRGITLDGAQRGNVLRTDRGRWFEVVKVASVRIHALPLVEDRSTPDWFATTSLRRQQFSMLGKRVGSEEYVTRRYDSKIDAARTLLEEERDLARRSKEVISDL